MGEQADAAKVVNFTKGNENDWDPFNPESLRAQGRDEEIGVQKVLLSVSVRKPKKGEFFRTHTDPDMHIVTKLYKNDDGESFIVSPGLQDVFGRQVVPVCLYFCVSRYGDPFLWPIRLPGDDGRDNSYWQTARDAAKRAETSWVRIEANQAAKNYSLALALGELPPPVWPELPLPEILELAFKNSVIKNRDDLMVKQFLGEV
ncbi:MAG TPA: hypothetical protein VGX71_25465 [Pseudaminobacter sp.]|nr:hypothetical protein [Pseudaminobacter sp.]